MIWCLLTEKRLLKKISYIAVLLILPILVLGLQRGSTEEAGMVSIGLYTPAEEGSLSDKVLQRFLTEKSVLRFYRYQEEAEALKALNSQKVDAIWILPENLEADLERLAKRGALKPIVRVIEREDDIALTFTREVLCSKIFPEYVYAVYREHLQKRLGDRVPSEEELFAAYDRRHWKGSLLQAMYMDGSEGSKESYFLAPIRGLLVIWLVLAGFAAILYQKMDESRGVYDGIPGRKKIRYALGLQTVVLFNGGIIYLLACKILGVFTTLGWELLLLVLLQIMIALFCTAIGLLVDRIEAIGIMIPIMTLLMVALCPIFINIRRFWVIQSIMPPYLYLKALHGTNYLKFMLLYLLGGVVVCAVLNRMKYRK
jgi:ABC-2 type transport system permease protein